MSRTKNVQYAKKLIRKLEEPLKLKIAYTGLFFYQAVVEAHTTGQLGGFDSGQGALNWNLKFFTASVNRKKPKKYWGYKYRGKIVRPKKPAGYKTQRHFRGEPRGDRSVVLKHLVEQSMTAFASRPKGFTSFTVYNPISGRFPGFEPGSPVNYAKNVFGEITQSTLARLLKQAQAKADSFVDGMKFDG